MEGEQEEVEDHMSSGVVGERGPYSETCSWLMQPGSRFTPGQEETLEKGMARG